MESLFGDQPCLIGIGKVTKGWPSLVTISHHSRRSDTLPTAAASDLCYAVPGEPIDERSCNMGMASGSPCVVPSWESRQSSISEEVRWVSVHLSPRNVQT